MAVRIDEPGHENLPGRIDLFDIGGQTDRSGIADGSDLTVLHEQNPLLDWLANDRDDLCIYESGRSRLSQKRTYGQQ